MWSWEKRNASSYIWHPSNNLQFRFKENFRAWLSFRVTIISKGIFLKGIFYRSYLSPSQWITFPYNITSTIYYEITNWVFFTLHFFKSSFYDLISQKLHVSTFKVRFFSSLHVMPSHSAKENTFISRNWVLLSCSRCNSYTYTILMKISVAEAVQEHRFRN